MKRICVFCLVLAALVGCRTRTVSPDQCWVDYMRYYVPTGVQVQPVTTDAKVYRLASAQLPSAIERCTAQGFVEIGRLTLADGTDITPTAVLAFAQKAQASIVLWSAVEGYAADTGLTNPDLGLAGTGFQQSMLMDNSTRMGPAVETPLQRKHTIYLFGKKALPADKNTSQESITTGSVTNVEKTIHP